MNSLILCHLIWSNLILSSQLELPLIKSIIDHIFSNYISLEIVSGNLTPTISDHLPQFLIAPLIFFQMFPTKNPTSLNVIGLNSILNISFLTILQLIGPIFWNFKITILMHLSKTFDSMSRILDKHAPLKKLSKYKLKFKTKPWITTALQKSISVKNKLFSDFINKKDLTQKTELHIKYKSYRNMLSYEKK